MTTSKIIPVGRGWVFDLCPDGWEIAFWKTWRRFRHRLTQFRPRAGPISVPFGLDSATFGFCSGPARDPPPHVFQWPEAFSKVGVLCGRGDQDSREWASRADEMAAGDSYQSPFNSLWSCSGPGAHYEAISKVGRSSRRDAKFYVSRRRDGRFFSSGRLAGKSGCFVSTKRMVATLCLSGLVEIWPARNKQPARK